MDLIKKYFTIGTQEWTVTVKNCLKIGALIGLFMGYYIVINIK